VALLVEILGGAQRASRHAPMLPPGDQRGKYLTVNQRLSDRQLAAHIAGTATYGAVIAGRDGLASAGMIELDHGAAEGAGRVRAAAQTLGVTMFSIVVRGAGEHDGSHSWALFAERTEQARVQALMRVIVAAAGLPESTETWPKGANIRLPFGVHTHTEQRGVYADTAGATFQLDQPDGLAGAISAARALPRNGPPPPLPEPEPRQPTPVRPATLPTTVCAESVPALIAAFNREHPPEALLAAYGAVRKPSGWACGCGVAHTHPTQLDVTSGGRIVFFSSRCGWAPRRTDRNGRPVADSFDLFTIVEHGGDKAAALRALRAAGPARPPNFPTTPTDGDRRGGEEAQAEARRKEAARKREARRREAATTLQAVRDRAADDASLTPCERAVLLALLGVAGERDWCRPSKARLCELSGYALGSVKRALMRLEARGYFASQGDGGRSSDTAIRTFLRGSSTAEVEPPFLRGSYAGELDGHFYVDHAGPALIREVADDREQATAPTAGEGGRSLDGLAGAPNHQIQPAADPRFLRGSSVEQEDGRCYVDHHDPRMIHESVGIQEHSTTLMAGEGGPWLDDLAGDSDRWACPVDPLPACGPDEWAALLASQEPAPAPLDPAALAAWQVEGGLCEVHAGELGGEVAGDEEAAIAADEARILAYRASRRNATVAPHSDGGGRVSFPGGASFDPEACCVEPFDPAAHWAQLQHARERESEREHGSDEPGELEPPSLVLVPRAQIDPDHRRRIAQLTSKAQFCRHKATTAASRAQRRWARQEAERLFHQVRLLKAEQVSVSPELARQLAAQASTPTAAAPARHRGPASPALGFVQGDLFGHAHKALAGGAAD
jgi:hypothetical protein